MAAAAGIGRQKFVEAGQVIFRQGDETLSYAAVLSGVLKLTKTLAAGQEGIAGLLFAGDFAGRFHSATHGYSAVAATDAQVCIFPSIGFHWLLRQAPGLERQLFEAASDQLSCCRQWAMLLRQPQAIQKVSGFLLFLTRRLPASSAIRSGREVRFVLPLARREIADFLGLTNETVSRQMTLLRALSVIGLETRREVVVNDIRALAALAAEGTGGETAGYAVADAAPCEWY